MTIPLEEWRQSLKEQAENKDEYVLIRGFPRPRKAVEEVQKMYGATLVPDTELDLIAKLDNALRIATLKNGGERPESIGLYSDKTYGYIPIPFNIQFQDLVIPVYHKPVWMRYRRHF